VLATLVLATLVLAVATAALAGPPGRWTPVSKGSLQASDEAGVARTPDSVLHVAWVRRGLSISALWQTRIGSDGGTLGLDAVAGGLSDVGSPALTASPDGGQRAFFFARAADGTGSDLRVAASPPNGGWTLVPDPLAHVAGPTVPTVSAAATRDGAPIVAWSTGTQLRYRFGVDPGAAGAAVSAGGCCASAVRPAVDAVTGQVYLAWASSVPGATGIFVEAVDRGGPTRPKVFATGSSAKKRNAAVLPDGRVALSARLGQPGVFLAYTSGFPKVRAINLLQAGARRLVIRIKAPLAAHVVLAPAPQGRLWLAWSRAGKLYAVRTNRAVSRLGAIREIPIRRGARAVEQLDGDGAGGPLDLVASFATRAGAVALWHQQVLPGLTLSISATPVKNGPTRYLFKVSDAGEPVANATVVVGKQSLTTGLAGTVVLSTTDHPTSATASKLGYAPASTPVP
jgi:hypothetical protein